MLRQSARVPAYRAALERLWRAGLLFHCTCTRREIALSAPQEGGAPLSGPDGVVYPGTCRGNRAPDGPLPRDGVLRLDMGLALERLPAPPGFTETGAGPDGQTGRIAPDPAALLARVGDVALARRGMGTSYHLSVVLDDAHQRVTHVTRGRDLFEATQIHVVLQGLMGLPVPVYYHHRLIRDADGKRLAKRDDARAIATYREAGATPEDIRRMVGLTPSAPA